jgi:HK97 family phage major capsid protein
VATLTHDYLAWRKTHPRIAGGDHMSLEELRDRQQAIRGRLTEIHNEFAGQAFPDPIRGEWNDLNEERERNKVLIRELEAREERVRAIATDDDGSESRGDGGTAQTGGRREAGATFHVPSVNRGSDPWDYTHTRSAATPEGQRRMMHDQVLRATERTQFPHPEADQNRCQADVERTLRVDDEHATIARRILNTGNPVYQRAFAKTLAGVPTSPEETRALGLTNTAGGYAVPFTLDPTIINTSNGAVNPYRQISRIIQIAGTTWQGVTSAGVVATRRAEGDEVADNSPTIAQPAVTPQRVDVFIPFSIEIGQDWQGMQGDMAALIQDAKDVEEATSFSTGSGTAPAAQGVLTGATTTVTAAGTASFAVADLYTVEGALPPRFRPNAQWVANRAIYNRVRQFDTAGGASLWTETLAVGLNNNRTGNTGYNLIGYPANEASAFATTVATGTAFAVLGDFRQFVIVDRVGMDVELVPHLFGSNRRPTGQRGIFAMWRNTSAVLVPGAFRKLVGG